MRPTIVVDLPENRLSRGGMVLLVLTPWAMFLLVLGGIGTNNRFFWYLPLTLIIPACTLYCRRELKRIKVRYQKQRAELPAHPLGRAVCRPPGASINGPEGPLIRYVGFMDFGLHPDHLRDEEPRFNEPGHAVHAFWGEMFRPAVRWSEYLLWVAAGMFLVCTAVLDVLPRAWYMATVASWIRTGSYVAVAIAVLLWLYRRYVRVTELWLYPGRVLVRTGWCLEGKREKLRTLDFVLEPGLQITLFDERPPWKEALVVLHDLKTSLRIENGVRIEIPLRRCDRSRFIDTLQRTIATPPVQESAELLDGDRR